MNIRTKEYIFPNKIMNQEIFTHIIPDVSFPDFDAVTCTFIGLNNVFSNTIKRGDNNFPLAVIVGCIV